MLFNLDAKEALYHYPAHHVTTKHFGFGKYTLTHHLTAASHHQCTCNNETRGNRQRDTFIIISLFLLLSGDVHQCPGPISGGTVGGVKGGNTASFQPRHPRRTCWSSGGLRRFSCRLLRRVWQPAAADLSGWSRANRPACRVPGFLLSFHCEEVAVGMAADSQWVCTWGWEACAS